VPTRASQDPDLLTGPHEVTDLDGRIHRLEGHPNVSDCRVVDHENHHGFSRHRARQGHPAVGDRSNGGAWLC
jgi:hypothetical protein